MMNFRTSIARRRSARAFTLVELLVVIAIIGVLVALLLPAVQAAREAARRTQCLNNMKNLGLALHNFHDSFGYFPPAIEYSRDSILANGVTTNPDFGPNWVIKILPFLEQQNLYDSFTFDDSNGPVFISDARNREARGTQLETMLCPSDPFTAEPFGEEGTAVGDNWARGNVGANSSLLYQRLENSSISPYPNVDFAGGIAGDMWQRAEETSFSRGFVPRGIMGLNLTLSMRQITDGTSQTVMLAEIRAGVNEQDRRGVWAMGSAGASSIWGHSIGDATGPNSCNPFADNIPNAGRIESVSGEGLLQQECMTSGSADDSLQVVPRSLHPGGIHVCMADASAHFISDDIDVGTCPVSKSEWLNRDCVGTWHKIMASQDGALIDNSTY